jgi:hypothetical protein
LAFRLGLERSSVGATTERAQPHMCLPLQVLEFSAKIFGSLGVQTRTYCEKVRRVISIHLCAHPFPVPAQLQDAVTPAQLDRVSFPSTNRRCLLGAFLFTEYRVFASQFIDRSKQYLSSKAPPTSIASSNWVKAALNYDFCAQRAKPHLITIPLYEDHKPFSIPDWFKGIFGSWRFRLVEISMASSYWESTQRKFWTFTKAQLAFERKKIEESERNLVNLYPLPDRRLLSIYFYHRTYT